MEGTMSVADLDDIENMVADREVNDDEVEHLLSKRLLDGFLLMERACPSCTTPLVKQPLNDASSQPWTPKESKKAISIIQKIQSQESPMSYSTTPRQAPAPIPGVPFCVNCKAHVVTHESEIQHLDSEHKTMRHQGKIMVDLLPPMSPEVDLYADMYETTTITSTSTQFQPAALREQKNISCSPMSTRTARTTSSGLLALAGSSMIPTSSMITTPTHANTKTHLKSTVMPSTLNEEKSVVPAPDDDDENEDEIEMSITPAPTPMSMSMSMTPKVLSPANSTFLPVAISEDEAPQEQQQRQQHDHEDDSLIEIDDDDETTGNDEAYEVIHLSDDTDVVEGGPRLEYTIDRTTQDSPPAQSATRLSLTGEDTNMASIPAAEIVMTLSNLEAESQAVLASKTNVQPPTPKLVIEQTVAEQIPHASPESTSATTTDNETAGERNDDLPEYSVRRDIATKVLAGKMMQGYSLTEQQCEKCSMPQVEYENKLECAVCPALKKRALKSREKEHRHLELEGEKKRLANQKHKIELEIRLKRIADSEIKDEHGPEKQRLAEQEVEQQRLIKLQQDDKQRLIKRQELEQQRLVERRAQAVQQQLAEQQAQAEKQQLAEKEIVHKAKLDEPGGEQGSVKSQFEGVRTIRRTPRSTPTPMISVNTEVEVRTIRHTPRSTPTPMFENHESIVPPSPTKVVELKAEEARLLAELQKEEVEFHAGNDVFRVKEAKINEAIMKGNQLLLQETRRLQELEKHRMEAIQMPAKGMLADLSAQEQRKMREQEAMLRKEIEAAEQARDEATLEARRLADEKRAMEEARLIVALEEEATTSQNAAEKALENAKAARDHVASAQRDIFAKTIADGVADAIAEAEMITRAEREDYYEQVILPTASALRRESWETLRAEGRSVMTRRIMAGWTLLPEFCRGLECESSPLLCKHAAKMCVVCGGDGSGTDGAYNLSDDDEMDFDDDTTKDSTIRPPLEISTFGAIAPVTAELEDTTGPSTSAISGAFETKRNMVCKSLIGKKMSEGWTLIDMACPHCVMPLMTTPEGIGEVCVLCGPVSISNQNENPAEVSDDGKETKALANEAQSGPDPQEQPFSLSSRIKQLDTKVEKSFVRNAQSSRTKKWGIKKALSPRIKQLGINVETSLVKKVQSLATKNMDKSVSSPKLEQVSSDDSLSRKKKSVSSRIKQYLSAAVGKNASTKEQSVTSAEQETEKPKFTVFKRAKSVPRAKLDASDKSISSKSNSYSTKDSSVPSRVKQSNSSAERFVAKSEQSSVNVKLDVQHTSVSSEAEEPDSTEGNSIAMMAQSVAMVAQLIESDKQDGQQLNSTLERGAVSEVSACLDGQKAVFSSKIKHYLNAAEDIDEDQEHLSSEKAATDSTTEIPAVEMVKSEASANPDDQEKSDSFQSTDSEEEQSVASAQYGFPQSLDSLADFSKADKSLSSSHVTDDRYASLHATSSEISVKGVSGRFEVEATMTEAVEGSASPYYRPAHLFTTTKSLYRDQSPRKRGDPPALQGHATRRSNAVDPEDSRSSSGNVEENKKRNVTIEAVPGASLKASRKQTTTVLPGDPPQDDSAEIPAEGAHEETAAHSPEKSRNGTAQMATISPKQKQAPADSPGEPPQDSVSTEAGGSVNDPAGRDSEQMANISISTEQTSEESRSGTDQTPKESLKEPPTTSPTGTSNETLDNDSTKDSATSATQRKSNKIFDRIEFIKERREKILARKLQINASNDDSESERSSEPTMILEMPKGFDTSDKRSSGRLSNSVNEDDAPPLGIDFDTRDNNSSRRLSNSAKGRDAPPLGIDTSASVHRSVMHLPSPGMTEASCPKAFSSPGGASVRSSVTTPSGMASASRPRITPEDFRPRSSSRQRRDSVSNSKVASRSRNDPPSGSTKSTLSPGLPRDIPGKFRGHSRSKQSVQPEVIVIGGPLDKQVKRSPKGLPAPSGSTGDDASIESSTLDALLNRIEVTKAELEQTPRTTNRVEQQTRLKALIGTLSAAADEVERQEMDCLSE